MDTGLINIQNDKYATASSAWLQVSRQGTAKHTLHIGLHTDTHAHTHTHTHAHTHTYIYVCVCFFLLDFFYVLKFSFAGIILLFYSFVNFQKNVIH